MFPSTYLALSSCDRNRPPPSQVACKLTLFAPPFTQLTHPSQIPRTPPAPRLTMTTSGIFRLLLFGTVGDIRHPTSTTVIPISEENMSDWKLSFRYRKGFDIDIWVHSNIRYPKNIYHISRIRTEDTCFYKRAPYISATVLIFEFLDDGSNIRIKVYSNIQYNVGLRSLQSDIGSSDIKLSLKSLITHIGVSVSHPGKGGCADPVNEDAILERVGGRPPGRNRERQLASDTGDGKTWSSVRWRDSRKNRKTTPSRLRVTSMHRVS